MGNFLVFKSTLNESYRSDGGLSLEFIHKKLFVKYLTLQAQGQTNTSTLGVDYRTGGPVSASTSSYKSSTSASTLPSPPQAAAPAPLPGNYGFSIDFPCFHKLFTGTHMFTSLEEAVVRFKLWDSDNDGVIDILELFACLVLLSSNTFLEKVTELFHMFDFDDSGGLNLYEFTSLIQRCAAGWNRLLGTERGKELHPQEMDEVAKRGIMYLTYGLEKKTLAPQIPLYRLYMWCGVTGLIAVTLGKHFTTDGDEVRAFWNSVLNSGGNGMSVEEATAVFEQNKLIAVPYDYRFNLLQKDANKIHQAFKSWIPLFRHMLSFRLANNSQSSTTSSTTAAAAAELAEEEDELGVAGVIPKVADSGDDIRSKFDAPTASSSSKSLKQPKVKGPKLPKKLSQLQETLRQLELKEHGINGAGHDRALATAAATTSKATGIAVGRRDRDELERHRPAYLAIKRIKAKVSSKRSRDDPAFQHFVYDHNTLRQAKHLFDSIDLDGSGEIEIAELGNSLADNPHLGAAISAFKSLDVDQTGTIEFGELLRALFPLATSHHVKLMCVEVKAIELTKKDIEILQKVFEWIDEDFDGKVLFRSFLDYLKDPSTDPTGKRKAYSRDYVPTKSVYELNDDRLMQFHECIHELFAKSHMHMIGEIKKWAQSMPVFALTDQQHVELEQLFELYDADGSGTIDMDELVAHFTKLGFNDEDNERMFRMIDRDGGGDVDMIEFKRFYRSVYDSTSKEDYGRGVTTFSGSSGWNR